MSYGRCWPLRAAEEGGRMPSGAAAVRRPGKRGTAWAIKWTDAAGRQCWETLGREPAWNEAKAQRELGKRLQAVQRDRWRKPEPLTFQAFSKRFMSDYVPGRSLKRTTVEGYHQTLDRHLLPFLGDVELAAIEPELLDAYVALKASEGLSSKTITNHLLLLNVMLRRAVVWRLIPVNPVAAVDRPRLRRPDMSVLTEAEVARLWTAYMDAQKAATEEERAWWRLAHALTFTALGTALRRGELLGLRWRDIGLLEGRLTVREAFVRGRFTTPKSEASRRTIELGPRTAELLREHWRQSAYQGDDELTFGHPTKGTPADASKVSEYMRSALKKAGIAKPFRAFHDCRHTSLTHAAAAGNPTIYVQHRAGHSQAAITERYLHAAQVLFPGAAEAGEARIFAELKEDR
jgi:integrase